MRFEDVSYGAALPVEGYGPGFFRLGGEVTEGPVICVTDQVTRWAGLEDGAALLSLLGKVDVVLIGMGAELRPLPAALRRAFEEAGLAYEIMPTPSAARTYNVLLGEGRRVAVALLPV